jgi:ribosomal-protein-alanine N-acetyltransferase
VCGSLPRCASHQMAALSSGIGLGAAGEAVATACRKRCTSRETGGIESGRLPPVAEPAAPTSQVNHDTAAPASPPLTDGVITLRSPLERDLLAIERGIFHPEVVRWIGPPDSARGLLELNRSRWAQGTGATFSICDADDACLGRVWVNLAGSGRGSVGYWLLPEARGKDFATRSVKLISRWVLGDLGLARLSLFTEPSNRQSRRVAERSGFVKESVLRSYADIRGRRVDNVVFSLLSTDLNPGNAR